MDLDISDMVILMFLIFGASCALLCHWMIRHTYQEFELEELAEKDPKHGWKRYNRIWTGKLKVPRWKYILLWVCCLGFAPAALLLPILVALSIFIQHQKEEWHFSCKGMVWRWLLSIKTWLIKEV